MPSGKSISFFELLATLEDELRIVQGAFNGLNAAEWMTATKLEPAEHEKPPWTLFELAGHLDISVGLTSMLIAHPRSGAPERDRVNFFDYRRAEIAPLLYEYAYTMVEARTPTEMPRVLQQTFAAAVQDAKAASPGHLGTFQGFEPYPAMRLDDFISTRILEAVIHGIDLTDALDRPTTATPAGIAFVADLFDDFLLRRAVPERPPDLVSDVAWIRAASGRTPHSDPRLPLIG
jgi:hypothetical protein